MAKIVAYLLFVFSLFGEVIELSERSPHLGLSAHTPPLHIRKLKKLAYMGIDYTFHTSFPPSLKSKGPTQREGGLILISDFNSKAKVFRKWLEMAQFRPSKIVTFDEGQKECVQDGKRID